MYRGRDDKWTEFYFVIHSALVYLKNFFWDETIQFLSCTIFALSGVTRLPRVKRRRRKSWGKGKCMTKQMKLNLANCYQKMLTEKKIQTLLIMVPRKLSLLYQSFYPWPVVLRRWSGGGGGGRGQGFFNKFSTSERWIWDTDRVGHNHLLSNKCEWNNWDVKKTPQNIDKSSQLLTY